MTATNKDTEPQKNICTHGTTGPSEPQKAHTISRSYVQNLITQAPARSDTLKSHISQRFCYTQMGGVEVPTKPLKDSCRSYS